MGRFIAKMHLLYDEYHAKAKTTYERCRSSLKLTANFAGGSVAKEKCEKSPGNGHKASHEAELFIVALCILGLCCLSARYGKMAFSLLRNGKIVHGSVPSKAVIIFYLGYSMPHLFLLSIAACLLIYSLVSEKANWTLPFIVIYSTDLIFDVVDAVVAIFLYFTYLRPILAFLYTVDTILIIMIEVWVLLGVYKHYKSRAFK